MPRCPTSTRAAGRLTAEQAACARHVISENARVLRTRDLLASGRSMELGPELTASHASLRDDFRVTVPQLDCAVDAALAAGARGARMTGGGFGGCTIALVDTDGAAAVQGRSTRVRRGGLHGPRALPRDPVGRGAPGAVTLRRAVASAPAARRRRS